MSHVLEDGENVRASLNAQNMAWLEAGLPALRERAKTLVELWSASDFLLSTRPLSMDDKALSLVSEEGTKVIKDALVALENANPWDHETIDSVLRTFAEEKALKFGKVAQPIRAALTGKASSPGAFDVLLMLGKTESLARLYDRV